MRIGRIEFMTTAITKTNDLKGLLDTRYKGRIAEILRDRAPQFAAALVQVVNRSWALQKCKPESVIGAAITAAALDLSFDPNLGEAHLVPYGEQCTFQLGYRGLIQLAQRSAQYKQIGWMVIYDGQLISWNPLSGELVIDVTAKKSDTILGYAAYFKLLNGFERSEYWTKDEVTTHAGKFSQAFRKDKKDSPWFTAFDRMALKTVMLSLIRPFGPKSIQMQSALSVDNTTRRTPVDEPEPAFDIEAEPLDEPQAPATSEADAPKTNTEKEPPSFTPQQHLEHLIEKDLGHTFETFRKWGESSGNVPDAMSLPDWASVPSAIAERIVKSKKVALKEQLEKV
jgi:recombination protein RecT